MNASTRPAGANDESGQDVGSGNGAAPHLHFDVMHSCRAVPPDGNVLPAGETLPLSFANATPDSSCDLRDEVSYTAQP